MSPATAPTSKGIPPRVMADINVNVEGEITIETLMVGANPYLLIHLTAADDGALEVDVRAAGFDSGSTPQTIADAFHVTGNMLHRIRDKVLSESEGVLDVPAENTYGPDGLRKDEADLPDGPDGV